MGPIGKGQVWVVRGCKGGRNHFKRGEEHESIELSSIIELGAAGAIPKTTFAYAKVGHGGNDEFAGRSRAE